MKVLKGPKLSNAVDVCVDQFKKQYPDLPHGDLRQSLFNAFVQGFKAGMNVEWKGFCCAVGDWVVLRDEHRESCVSVVAGLAYAISSIVLDEQGKPWFGLVGAQDYLDPSVCRPATVKEVIAAGERMEIK